MSRRFYNLPPLTTLGVFEAAARHSSFKDAAQELSVTPAAVSHQIKALESELGAILFLRKHRGVELTYDGEALFDTLSASFSKISHSLQAIRDRSVGDFVRIGSTSAVAALWLGPTITEFWRRHQDISVNQVTQDHGFSGGTELDMFIRYGRNVESRFNQIELYRDELVPVASPEVALKLKGCNLNELASQRLVHLESVDRSWTSWYDWFAQMGYDGPIAAGARVNNYAIALQAAQDSAGIALGWKRLIQPLLDRKVLVPIGHFTLAAPHRFYLVSKPDIELSEPAQKLRDWMIAEKPMLTD